MSRIVRFSHTGSPNPVYGIVDEGRIDVIEPHPFTVHRRTGRSFAIDDVRLLAPVLPSKVVCVGKNYREHIAEMGGEAPPDPLLFLKPSTSVIGPFDPIRIPQELTEEVHHEGELAVVIGRLVAQLTPEQARDAIYGFTIGNDVTARDLQRRESQWTRAKGMDTFCPLGPAIATDIDPFDAHIRVTVDGELRQEGSTAEMVRDVLELVAYVSQAMTLLPGDVVLTGTPSGVGPIVPGNTVRVEIDGIGVLENPVEAR